MKNGLGTQVVHILIPWVTPAIFLLSAQITYNSGVLGLLGFSFTGILSYYVFFFLKNKTKVTAIDPRLKKLMFDLLIIESAICIFLVCKIIITGTFFDNPLYITSTLIITVSIFFLFIKNSNMNWISTSILLLGLIVSFLIPTIVYLKVSIPTVYSGLHFLATDMLMLNNKHTWMFILILFIIMIAHQFLQFIFYDQEKSNYRGASYIIASFIWGIVPISLGSLAFLAKAQAIWPNLTDRVSLMVINTFGGQFGKTTFILISIIMIFNQVSRFQIVYKRQPFNKRFYNIFAYLLVPSILLFFNITILDVVLFFGLLFGPMLGIILWASVNKYVTRTVYMLGVTVSFIFYFIGDIYIGVLMGTIVSGILMNVINHSLKVRIN